MAHASDLFAEAMKFQEKFVFTRYSFGMRQISGLSSYSIEHFGVNAPRLGFDEEGRQVLFKVNRQADNATEILGSQLLVNELGQLGVVTEDAVTLDGGERGVSSQFLSNHRTLKEAGMAAVTNGDQLVGQVIFRDFLGDWDAHSGNYLVGPDGVAKSIDLGKSGNKGIMGQGPKSNHEQILASFGNRHNISTYVNRIRNFSDEDIQQMVGRAASKLEEPAPLVEQRFVEALTHQRTTFRNYNLYKAFGA